MRYRRHQATLDNGLRLVWDHRSSYESFAATLLVGAGSYHDLPGRNGLAHFVEHVVFRSTGHRDDSPILRSLLDAGGFLDAWTGVDSTVFELYTHRDDAWPALETLTRMVSRVSVDETQIAAEKRVVMEELRLLGEDHKHDVHRVKFGLMGSDESQRHSIIGSRKTINRITSGDLERFHRTYFVPRNMVLSVVGNFDPDADRGRLERMFRGFPEGEPSSQPVWLPKPGPKLAFNANAPDSLIYLFIRCPELSPRVMPIVELMVDLLIGGPHSRVTERLREQEGLVYALDGGLGIQRGLGTIDIYAALAPAAIPGAYRCILEELDALRREPPAGEPLERLKTAFVKRRLLQFEAPAFAAGWHAYQEHCFPGDPVGEIGQWIAAVEAITADRLAEQAALLLRGRNVYGYAIGRAGPFKRLAARRALSRGLPK